MMKRRGRAARNGGFDAKEHLIARTGKSRVSTATSEANIRSKPKRMMRLDKVHKKKTNRIDQGSTECACHGRTRADESCIYNECQIRGVCTYGRNKTRYSPLFFAPTFL